MEMLAPNHYPSFGGNGYTCKGWQLSLKMFLLSMSTVSTNIGKNLLLSNKIFLRQHHFKEGAWCSEMQTGSHKS